MQSFYLYQSIMLYFFIFIFSLTATFTLVQFIQRCTGHVKCKATFFFHAFVEKYCYMVGLVFPALYYRVTQFSHYFVHTVAEYGLSSNLAAINRGVWSECHVISGLVAMENNNADKQWMCLFPHNKERQAEKSLLCSFATGYKAFRRLDMFILLNNTTQEACFKWTELLSWISPGWLVSH